MKYNVVPAINQHRKDNNLENETFYLTLDGHASHHSSELDEFLLENNIVLVFFPPHCSNIVQPLDRGVFHAFKAGCNRALHEYQFLRLGVALSLPLRIECMMKAWNESVTPDIIRSSFYYAGMSPLNYEIAFNAVFGFSGPSLFRVPEVFTLEQCTIKNVYGVDVPVTNMGFVLQAPSNPSTFSTASPSSDTLSNSVRLLDSSTPSTPLSSSSTSLSSSSLDISFPESASSVTSTPIFSSPSSLTSTSSTLTTLDVSSNSIDNSTTNSNLVQGDLILSSFYSQIIHKNGHKLKKKWKYQLVCGPRVLERFGQLVDVISVELKKKIMKLNDLPEYSSMQVGATNTVQFHAARWRAEAKTKVNKIKSKKEFVHKLNAMAGDAYKNIDRKLQLGKLRKVLLAVLTEDDLTTFLNAPAVEIRQEPAFPSVRVVRKKKAPKEKPKKDGPSPAIAKRRQKRADAVVEELNKLLLDDSTATAVDGPVQIDLTAQPSPVGSSAPSRKPSRRPKKAIPASATLSVDTGVLQQPGTAGDATPTLTSVATLDVNAVSTTSAPKNKTKYQKKN